MEELGTRIKKMKKESLNQRKLDEIFPESKFVENVLQECPKRLQIFFDSFEDFIFILGLDGRILYANLTLQKRLGYSADEILSMYITGLHPLEQIEKVKEIFSNMLVEKKCTYNIPLITRDKMVIPVETKIFQGKWEEQNILISISQNVSARVKAEKELRESQRRLSTLMSNMPGMAYQCQNNKNWTMEFISEGFFSLTGYRPEEYLWDRNNYRDLIHPDDREYIWDEVQRALSEKRSFRFVWRLLPIDGDEKWVWEQGVGIFSDDGKLLALEGFVTDVTEQKKIELQLFRENELLKRRIKDPYKFDNIIGQSNPMQKVYDLILQAADSNATVIIYGESGTGKELVARAIHDMGERRDKRFVPVNCGAIPENLIESEFFGYKKGAFTGATDDKPGYLDLADGGILFLDEVGEINLNMQVKLLRAIESTGYTPVGGNQVKRPDIRIIAATNKDLKEYVKKGLMREDFFYRIHIIPIYLPPLRERKEDIPLLVFHFLKIFSNGKTIKSIPQKLINTMQKYDWPGNIRELQNVLHRYITIGQIDFMENKLTEHNEQSFITDNESFQEIDGPNLQNALDKVEKQLIIQTLEHNHWHRGHVASLLGINYRTLLRKMKRYNLIES